MTDNVEELPPYPVTPQPVAPTPAVEPDDNGYGYGRGY